MAKLRVYIILLMVSFGGLTVSAQYRLNVVPVDRDSRFIESLLLPSSFKSRADCADYIGKLNQQLTTKGYPASSIDSLVYKEEEAFMALYLGPSYKIGVIKTDSLSGQWLLKAGLDNNKLSGKPLDIGQMEAMRNRVIDYMENNGYPFASVRMDSLRFEDDRFFAHLTVQKGPLYKIDSIRNFGDASISSHFMQRYLDILNGSRYEKSKLENITKKIRELPYVQEIQPWDLTMHGSGSVLNLYLKPKKSSQFNALIGLLPSNEQLENNKLLVTGEANINLRNALGNGEMIGINWQQLQVKAPRLDLAYEQPYMFGTPFGITSSFNLFKKDSSFLNLSLLLGIQYSISATETGKLFIQNLRTNLLTLDTFAIKNTRALPPERDVSSINLGIDYEMNRTDYRFNPRKGIEWRIVATAGTRKIRKNNVITELKSADFSYEDLYDSVQLNSYQFRVRFSGAHYLKMGRQSTLKTAFNGGWFQSPEIYRNELFQIGGYKLLRGFDEESIYVSRFAVASIEYRYLIGINSFLFSFADVGFTASSSKDQQTENSFAGAGIGLAFETKSGIFNISYAAGKRNDLRFDIRQAKIHIGYVSYF